MVAPPGFGEDVGIGWQGLRTYPGILAGGRSGTRSAAGRFDDRRDLTGTYRLVPVVDARGVRTAVRLEADLRLRVLDAVDFCPGATAMSPILVHLSRLERTAHPDGGEAGPEPATFARPVLFALQTELDRLAIDVGALYGGNDRDGDGRPDTQPYAGARFALDPCPATTAPRCRRR